MKNSQDEIYPFKERFIPEKKLTEREQSRTLRRLNQVIQNRMCLASSKLSPRITDIVIKNGMVRNMRILYIPAIFQVILTVPGEFEASLTLLGESTSINWTLLNIRILVEDHEIGQGTKLVHPLQLNLLHNLIQSRIEAKSNIDVGDTKNRFLNFFYQLNIRKIFCTYIKSYVDTVLALKII